MKKILYFFLPLLLICSCQKDEILDSEQLQMDNLYTITDDPNDSIQHRVYEIYEKYGVPVYFNDTIGQVLVTTDVNGQPYYRYETLDLGWDFDSYENLTYQFDYITDPGRKMELLDAVEYYLDNVAKSLRPYAFFITEGMRTVSRDGKNTTSEITTDYRFNFRVVSLIAGNWTSEPEVVMSDLERSYVTSKITFFTADLEEFNEISKEYLNQSYESLHRDIGTQFTTVGSGYQLVTYINGIDLIDALGTIDDWYYGSIPRTPLMRNLLDYLYGGNIESFGDDLAGNNIYNEEEKELLWSIAHYTCGIFGFVSCNSSLPWRNTAPKDANDDLQGYLKIILNTTDKDFRAEWANCPLVMEKYEILYRIITEELGVEL